MSKNSFMKKCLLSINVCRTFSGCARAQAEQHCHLGEREEWFGGDSGSLRSRGQDTSGGISGQESSLRVQRFVGSVTRKIVTTCIGKSQTGRRTSLWKEQSSVKIWLCLSCPTASQTEKGESQCVFS